MWTKLLIVVLFLTLQYQCQQQIASGSFKDLGKLHCKVFPIDIVLRLATGRLSEKYGSKYSQLDCYIIQFVNKDGQNKFEYQSSEEDEQQQIEEQIPQIDPIIQQYAQGLKECLPEGDAIEHTYAIWRLYRFILQHDYLYEWMRAKIRSGLGYQSQRPNAWMDGEQSAARLRLDKLYSNQFYSYVDELMFKQFLFPFMTFMRKNTVIGIHGKMSQTGKPILMQYIQSRNIYQQIFIPYKLQHKNKQIFTYTIPGIPLLLAGATTSFNWAFTGILVDRSNIQQIETLGNKFYHYDSQMWIKLNTVSHSIPVLNQQPYLCSYVHSNYGTLYTKKNATGKQHEYISKWHQKESKVRVLFSDIVNLVINDGIMKGTMQFPFNSIVMGNNSGIFHYICYQAQPSYFIYPDLPPPPDKQPRWAKKGKKNYLIVSNTHLTTVRPQTYLDQTIQNSFQQQVIIQLRKFQKDKISHQQLFALMLTLQRDPIIKKMKESLSYMYRHSKFQFFPEEQVRKQCDQIVNLLDKWNHDPQSQEITPLFILWMHFLRGFTFNHVSRSPLGHFIASHKAITNRYWTGQMDLWRKGTSYGECDSNQWRIQFDKKLNGTGHNSTCFFNIMRAINRTRQIILQRYGEFKNIKLSDFKKKKLLDLSQIYSGNDIDEAFGNFYSKNLAFVAEIGNPKVSFLRTMWEKKNQVILNDRSNKKSNDGQNQQQSDESSKQKQDRISDEL